MSNLELAELIRKHFTAFAFNCKDTGCNCTAELSDSDWVRYRTMNDIIAFIIKQEGE